MSRASWMALGFGVLVVVIAVVLAGGGLASEVVENAEQAKAGIEKANEAIQAKQAEIEQLVAKDPTYMAEQPEVKESREQLVALAAIVEAATERKTELEALLEEDDDDDEVLVIELADTLTARARSVTEGLGRAISPAAQVLDFKENAAKYQLDAGAASMKVRDVPSEALKTAQVQAIADYPKNEKRLQYLLDELVKLSGSAQTDLAAIASGKNADPPDYAALGRTTLRLEATARRLEKKSNKLASDLEALRHSVDKVLIDMKTDGGHQHKYRIIEDQASRETGWETVPIATYNRHKDHLGMTIYSKPEGVLPEDATEIAAPPGYNYVGNSRYGQWEHRGGSRYWAFYGRYAFMRNLYWGPSYYRPITYMHWNTYDRSRASGRPYYAGGRYGTNGTMTKKRYATSSFIKRKTARRVGSSRSGGSSGGSRSYGGGGK